MMHYTRLELFLAALVVVIVMAVVAKAIPRTPRVRPASAPRRCSPNASAPRVASSSASGAILALVELDDRSHDTARDHQRDAMTASAGYRTIRLPAGKLATADIAEWLQPLQRRNAGTSSSATRSGA